MTRRPPLCLLLLLWFAFPSTAASDTPHGPLVILLLPGTSLADWRRADAPNLHHILDTGAVAVMNTRTARRPDDHTRETPESAVLTLGAGSRAAGGPEITDFHPADAPVPGLAVTYGALYTRRTGFVLPVTGLVNPDWARVVRENGAQGYDLLPGNLGDGLQLHGLTMAAGGGGFAAALACHSDGTVPETVGGARLPHPLPLCTAWDGGADVTAADTLIAQAVSEITARDGRLMIVSPCVGDAAYARGERLAPVVVWGPGVPTGLLYSPATHCAGLVANTDFTSSVAAYFGATPRDTWLRVAAFGRPWEFRPGPDAVGSVSRLESDAYRQSRGMRALPALAIVLGVILLAALIRRRWNGLPGAVGWLPSVSIFALLVSPTPDLAGLWLVALGGLCWALASRWGDWRTNAWVAALTLLALIGDALSGSRLMRFGMLGYSAVEGARYYGIGNEAMGVLVGSALVAAAIFWPPSRIRRLLLAAGLMLSALMLGLPTVGAKAGGLLVAVGSFATFLWTAWGRRWQGRVVLGILVGMALALALASLSDRQKPPGAQSHMGQAVQRIHAGGLKEGADIILRKLHVEQRLLFRSAWAVPLWISLLYLLAPGWKRQEAFDLRFRALRYGGGAAMVCCLAANDAGVVAAALCGILVTGCLQTGLAQKKPAPPARSGTGRAEASR